MSATATAAASNPMSGRPRAPSSRHFSTSVSTNSSGDEKEKLGGIRDGASNGLTRTTPHPLRTTWVFWFRQQRAPGNKIVNYEEDNGIQCQHIHDSFHSRHDEKKNCKVESFWSLWTHLNPPSTLQPTTDYLLFHSAVRRPVWEDPLNLQGGKWIIRLKKGVSDRLWEELIIAVVGDQFDDCGPNSSGDIGESGTQTDGADASSWRHAGRTGTDDVETDGAAPADNEPEICGYMALIHA
ncbi:hypothetical protein EW145_g1691 [Phellinidium pouzarii]|uniref:Uncharacterized protein n=1 Tax=Phellinidium pouzarii TaxID=167371 RepID=A0A4V3XDI8_9AGAM|nr:hypothetical protein EW145_g1691 [Phellinidium pouzarii]